MATYSFLRDCSVHQLGEVDRHYYGNIQFSARLLCTSTGWSRSSLLWQHTVFCETDLYIYSLHIKFYLPIYFYFYYLCYFITEFTFHILHPNILFLIIRPARCTNFSNLFLEWNSTCVGQFLCPSSGVFHCLQIIQVIQVCWQLASKLSANLYDIYHCCLYSENSWWRTEELSDTCRVSFQK